MTAVSIVRAWQRRRDCAPGLSKPSYGGDQAGGQLGVAGKGLEAPLAGSGALAAPPLPVKGTNRRAWNRSMSARVAGVMTGEFNAV